MSPSPNLYAQLLDQAGRRAKMIALWHCRGGGQATPVTFGELTAVAQRFAGVFVEQTAPSPIIPLLLGKSPDCVAAMLGAVGAGKAFACLNRKLRWPQINGILQAIG